MTDYKAVSVFDQEALFTNRPQAGILVGDGETAHWVVIDPTDGVASQYPLNEVVILGDWTGMSNYILHGSQRVTWEAYSKHQAGQILRQHNLVDRLAAMGIDRFEKETYVSRQSPFKTDLRLTFNELDSLLPKLADQLS
jgi:hypothetical protein